MNTHLKNENVDYKNYKIIKSKKELRRLIRHCKNTGYASVDFETNAESSYMSSSYPTMLGVSFQPGSGWIIPLAHFDSPFLANDKWKEIFKIFCLAIIENPKIVKVAHNLKFEYNWFKKYGYTMRGRIFDTMLAKYLLNEERPHGLKELTKDYLPDFSGYEDYEGSNLPWDKKPLIGLAQYCAMDCDITLRLWFFFERKLIDLGFYALFRNMMMMGTRVLAESEFRGMLIDLPYLDKLVETKAKEINDLNIALGKNKTVQNFNAELLKNRKKAIIKTVKDEIREVRKIMDSPPEDKIGSELNKWINQQKKKIVAREDKISRYLTNQFTTKKELAILDPVNFASPAQMAQLLFTERGGFCFDIVKYTMDKKTKQESDNPSTDGEVLEKLGVTDKTGFIRNLLDLRGEQKLYGTYILGMRNKVIDDNCVHGRFLLHGTVTGRLSSKEPNLQNIPRDTTSSEIKQMFIPPPGHVIMQLDYSQAELRVLAAQANETSMLEWFNTGKDIHLASACKKYKAEYEDIIKIYEDDTHKEYTDWKIKRKQAKTINFGIVYGQGPKLLSESLSEPDKGIFVSEDDAKQFLIDFDKTFPRIAKFIKKQHKLVHKQAYVRNLFGRKRRLPNIDSSKFYEVSEAERQSVNAPIQGAASDFTLFSSILIRNAQLKGHITSNLKGCGTVHDSIIYYIKPKYLAETLPKLYKICRNPQTMKWFGFQIDSVEMSVDFEVGTNWGNLKNYDPNKDYESELKNTI